MADPGDATSRSPGRDRTTSPAAAALHDALRRDGPALFRETGALEATLRGAAAGDDHDVGLLLAAFDEQVPHALLGVDDDHDRLLLSARLEKRLQMRAGMNAYAAAWAVSTWRAALSEAASPATITTAEVSSIPDAVPALEPLPAAEPPPEPTPLAARGDPPRSTTPIHSAAPPLSALRSTPQSSLFAARRPNARTTRFAVALVSVAVVTAIAWVVPRHDAPPAAPARARVDPVARVVPAMPPPAPLPPAPPLPVASPPTIVGIATPQRIVAGDRSSMTIEYRADDVGLASIETRSVDRDARAVPVTVDLAALPSPRPGAVVYPLDMQGPARRAALDVVLIDRAGGRSAPKRVAFDVVASQGPVPSASDDACRPDRCGVVVAARSNDAGRESAAQIAYALGIPLSPRAAASHAGVQVTVRMDDRTTRVVDATRAPANGTRVRVVDGRVVALR